MLVDTETEFLGWCNEESHAEIWYQANAIILCTIVFMLFLDPQPTPKLGRLLIINKSGIVSSWTYLVYSMTLFSKDNTTTAPRKLLKHLRAYIYFRSGSHSYPLASPILRLKDYPERKHSHGSSRSCGWHSTALHCSVNASTLGHETSSEYALQSRAVAIRHFNSSTSLIEILFWWTCIPTNGILACPHNFQHYG